MHRIGRLFKAMAQHFMRNGWLSLVTIVIILFASISLHLWFITQSLFHSVESELIRRMDVALYLTPTATNDDALALKKKIEEFSSVANVIFESADDVYAQFLKRYERDPETVKALRVVETNPFGGVLRVRATSLAEHSILLRELEDPALAPERMIEKKNFDDRQEVLTRFTKFERTAEQAAQGFVGFFVLLSLVVIYNTIRMAIYSQREEIGIMKLVGATNWFIRLPFILEALLYVIIALVASFAIVVSTLRGVDPYIVNLFGSSQASLMAYYNQEWVMIVVIQAGGLALASIFSAAIAVGRYLKV